MPESSARSADEVREPLPAYPSPALIECPYPYFDRMRDEAPVARSEENDEYLVFKHEDIAHVLRNHERFSEDLGPTPFDRGDEIMISSRSGPDHRATRDFSYRTITPRRLKQIEPGLVVLVDELIESALEKGEVDFMADIALPIPGLLMCDLMGLSRKGEEGRQVLGHWGDLVAAGDHTASGGKYTLGDLLDFFERKLRERYANPGDDMLSEYVKAQVDRDGEVNFDFLTVVATEMLVGGAGTTALMMTNALWLMLTNPDQLARVKADPALIPWMLEESLRVESVVQERERIALEDTELSGVEIPAGSKLRLVFGAANRDPEVFEDPESFEVGRSTRKLKEHFGFGYGVHTCLGAPLARLEGKVAFERLFAKTSDVRLSAKNDYTHVYSTHFRSFKELWVELDPA
jgi:cytochrome P450